MSAENSSLKNFTLLAKLEALALDSHKIVARFPKSERHVLASDIRSMNLKLIELVIMAVKVQLDEREERLPPLETKALLKELDAKLECFRVLVRLAFSLRYINVTAFEAWTRQVSEIGRILGAWLKTVKEDIKKRQPRRTERQGSLL